MYTIFLTEEEYEALIDMIDCAISDLHTEIVHTDQRELKNQLKDRKQMLIRMLENVRIEPAAVEY